MCLESLPNGLLIPLPSHASKGLETDLQNQRAQAGLFIPWGPVETEALALLHFRTSVGLVSRRLASLATQAFFYDRFTVVQLVWRDGKLVFTETEALGSKTILSFAILTQCILGLSISSKLVNLVWFLSTL